MGANRPRCAFQGFSVQGILLSNHESLDLLGACHLQRLLGDRDHIDLLVGLEVLVNFLDDTFHLLLDLIILHGLPYVL